MAPYPERLKILEAVETTRYEYGGGDLKVVDSMDNGTMVVLTM